MFHEYYNIVIGGEGVRRRSNGINAEKITFFSTFVRVSKGLLSTIVAWVKNAFSQSDNLLTMSTANQSLQKTMENEEKITFHYV